MRFQALVIATVLAMTSTTIFAKGDGYDRSYEANKRFRERQSNIHKKQQPESQFKSKEYSSKSENNKEIPLFKVKNPKYQISAYPEK
jgi:hypothetical protein